jgi:hypothetical protein
MSTVVPSPFSLLLRRSKFASFDPAIAQVYYTHGGEAHRGNWGLKRPLALRRRTAMITVSSVDSRYQQTEWDSGQDQTRMVKKIEELDVHVDYHGHQEHSWQTILEAHGGPRWLLDTEFSPIPLHQGTHPEDPLRSSNGEGLFLEGEFGEEFGGRSETMVDGREVPSPPKKKSKSPSSPTTAIPNIRAMSDKQFDRYIVNLRKLRPQFRAFLDNTRKNKGKSMLALAQFHSPDRTSSFLATQAKMEYDSPTSRKIEPLPHPSAGLTYAHTPGMQTYLTTQPIPGFYCNARYTSRVRDKAASFVGMIVPLSLHQSDRTSKPLKRERLEKDEVEQSFGMWRLEEAPWLMHAPCVVGRKREDLRAVKMKFAITSKDSRHNPHLPGSSDYFRTRGDSRLIRYNEPRDEPRSLYLEMPRTNPQGEARLMNVVKSVLERQKDMEDTEDSQ